MFFSRFFRVLFLFLSLIFVVAASTAMAAGPDDIRVGFLSENKRVIPFSFIEGRYITTNVKIPEIVIMNMAPGAVEILSVDLDGKSNGEMLIKKSFPARVVKKNISEMGAKINKYRSGPYPMTLGIMYGRVIDPKKNFAETNVLQPSDIAALALWEVSWFEYCGVDRIDELEFKIFYRGAGKIGMKKFPVKIEEYKQKNKYMFPLKGNILIGNMAANYCHHRIMNSQEFGFDTICLNEKLSMNIKEPPEKLVDYVSYRREIYAAADGVVVKIADKFLDKYSEPAERIKNPNIVKDLASKIGFENAAGGNHIIIDHGNAEYGFYAHLSEGTIKVAAGDTVKKGQVIALLGNTGNSSGPHLHFQIFDFPDFIYGNGLPVYFENISVNELSEYRKEYNSLGNSDNLRLRIE